MAYSPMFFMQIMDALLDRTDPASSIVNPAHIHITSTPQTRNEYVLRTNPRSPPPFCAARTAGAKRRPAPESSAAVARFLPAANRRDQRG